MKEKRSDNSFTLIAESVDAVPDGFEDPQWKLKMTKLYHDQFIMRLDMGKEITFTRFWEAQYNRI